MCQHDRRTIDKKTKVLANKSDKKVGAEKNYGLKGGEAIALGPQWGKR